MNTRVFKLQQRRSVLGYLTASEKKELEELETITTITVNTTTISVRSFPAEVWRKFQAECILRSLKPSVALKQAIEAWLKTNKK